MAVKAVRGAIQIKKNEENKIEQGVLKMIKTIIDNNDIDINNIISIIFSQTSDLDAMNPAAALRTDGFSEIPLFCTKEPEIIGSMKRVIRVLITTESDKNLKPVYLDGAEKLRLDLIN
ncbi:MAG: chorismate mutase [Spirochaetales bacterium]|nr:chorismate mutase [Spirochaetales bacterium]